LGSILCHWQMDGLVSLENLPFFLYEKLRSEFSLVTNRRKQFLETCQHCDTP